MTKLTSGKSVTRETAAPHQHLPLIVELHPGFLILRQKGKRDKYMLDYGAAFDLARKIDFQAKRKEQGK
jgi:hypothetical protein